MIKATLKDGTEFIGYIEFADVESDALDMYNNDGELFCPCLSDVEKLENVK